jgi:hypothetical protein
VGPSCSDRARRIIRKERENKSLGKPRRRWNDNIKNIKKQIVRMGSI